ncbi:unnamed protein product [Ambrosiozyma monospora]|uniref:Unnamed protein product n=1 Tax=Ambrosiozyma monospora TaxID=43982 RepID=A0ACB5UCE1_AMBMO|nr:unnamed protein product [Ambrosiozyma monospora]
MEALQDFESCINYNDFFYQGCFDKYIDMCFQSGRLDDIESKLKENENKIPHDNVSVITDKLNALQLLKKELGTFYSQHQYSEAVDVSKKILQLSPYDAYAKSIQLDSIKNIKDIPYNEKLETLSKLYVDLLNNGDQNLTHFVDLFKLQYFGEATDSPINTGTKVLKNCLKIDNDFQDCRK